MYDGDVYSLVRKTHRISSAHLSIFNSAEAKPLVPDITVERSTLHSITTSQKGLQQLTQLPRVYQGHWAGWTKDTTATTKHSKQHWSKNSTVLRSSWGGTIRHQLLTTSFHQHERNLTQMLNNSFQSFRKASAHVPGSLYAVVKQMLSLLWAKLIMTGIYPCPFAYPCLS